MKKITKLCFAMLFVFLLMPAVTAHAAGDASIKSGNGTAASPYDLAIAWDDGANSWVSFPKAAGTHTYFKITYEKNSSLVFQSINESSVEYKSAFDDNFYSYLADFANGKNGSTYTPSGATTIFRILNSEFSSSTGGYGIGVNNTPTAGTVVQSGTGETLPLGGLAYRKMTSGTARFTINVDHPCYIMLSFYNHYKNAYTAMPTGSYYMEGGYKRNVTASSYKSEYNATPIWFTKGSYTFYIPYDGIEYSSSTKYFTFYATAKEYDWGKVKFAWANNYSDFTVTYTPGNNPDGHKGYMSSWTYPYDSKDNSSYGSWVTGNVGKGHIIHAFDSVGYAPVTIKISGHDQYKNLTDSTGILAIRPQTPTVALSNVTRNSAIINLSLISKGQHGDYLLVQRRVGSNWKTIKTVAVTSNLSKIGLTGLAANTSYTMRVIGKANAKNGYGALTGAGKIFTFRTGLGTKPSVKSVKISKVKVKKVPRRFVMGHWIGSGANRRYLSGYYVGGYVTTSYRVTVTLRTPARGSKGLWVDGVFIKGTGKKFSGTVTVNGKSSLKGKKKKITICSAMDKGYGGLSPSVTQTKRIK